MARLAYVQSRARLPISHNALAVLIINALAVLIKIPSKGSMINMRAPTPSDWHEPRKTLYNKGE
jgi:hypothetical protein